MTWHIITIIAVTFGISLIGYAIFGPVRIPRRSVRKAKRRAALTGQLPKTNGRGSKHGNRRLWRGHNRKIGALRPRKRIYHKRRP